MWDCTWYLKIWSLSAEPIERYIQAFAFHKSTLIFSAESEAGNSTATFQQQNFYIASVAHTCLVALRTKYFTFIMQYFTSWLKERGKTPAYDHPVYTITSLLQPYRAYSLTWHSPMLIYMNKKKFFHNRRVQFPQSCLWTTTWLPFHCFGTPTRPLWCQVSILYLTQT